MAYIYFRRRVICNISNLIFGDMYDSRVYIKGEIEPDNQSVLFVGDHILEVNEEKIKSKHLHQQYEGLVMLTVIFDEYSISKFTYYLLIPHEIINFEVHFFKQSYKNQQSSQSICLTRLERKKSGKTFFKLIKAIRRASCHQMLRTRLWRST